ncbi:MAG: phosphopentomutase [Sedimentitalea sp.]
MPRAFLVVLDSVGIGGAPDADAFFNGTLPDTGANTLGHIRAAAASLYMPNLARLGLFYTLTDSAEQAEGRWGRATEISPGKDTPSGHWELAGVPVPWDWHYFPNAKPAFPEALVQQVAKVAGTKGILGNCHASGTEIIAQLGARHIETGWPICYTSADSVFQIAAHEHHFGLEALLTLCATIAPQLHAMKVGRVIARPFGGTPETGFQRTSNRRDYAIAPPSPVLTNWVQNTGRRVYGVGKIGDIFSMAGIDELRKGPDAALMDHLSDLVDTADDNSLTFANFVEFDSLYGHRRDVAGYARHLEWFDAAIGPILARLRGDDIMIFTADHGNDPTWPGTDHTREQVPVVVAGKGAGPLGQVAFADVAASIAAHLGVPAQGPGRTFF